MSTNPAQYDTILSPEEEAALSDALYEDIKSGKLTTLLQIAHDRKWMAALVVYRLQELRKAGRIAFNAATGVHYVRLGTEIEISSLKEFMDGKTITNVTCRTSETGDRYHRLYFGNHYYEFLAHFTANDHQVAVAKEALRKIELGNSAPSAGIAAEALKAMEVFDETTHKADEKSTCTNL